MMKYPSSPAAMRWVAATDVLAGMVFGLVAIIDFRGWDALFSAFMSGGCFVAAIHTVLLGRANHIITELNVAMRVLNETNVNLMTQLADRYGSPSISPNGPAK